MTRLSRCDSEGSDRPSLDDFDEWAVTGVEAEADVGGRALDADDNRSPRLISVDEHDVPGWFPHFPGGDLVCERLELVQVELGHRRCQMRPGGAGGWDQ